jgi:glycosyltransferase 2 family protein
MILEQRLSISIKVRSAPQTTEGCEVRSTIILSALGNCLIAESPKSIKHRLALLARGIAFERKVAFMVGSETNPPMRASVKAFGGIAFGLALAWFAITQIDVDDARRAIGGAQPKYLFVAAVMYWLGLGIRVIRWHLILSRLNPLAILKVARALVIGYAVNNIMPARLGELFRAEYLRRKYKFSRSAALGSILVERFFDGIIAVSLLGFGVALTPLRVNQTALLTAMLIGISGLAVAAIAFFAIVVWDRHGSPATASIFRTYLNRFATSFAIIYQREAIPLLGLTLLAWGAEAAAISNVLWSFSVDVSPSALCLVFGAAALSTLFPSAPGYVGSFQIAFIVSYAALGLSASLAVVSATAVQVFLFGSITVVGLLIWIADQAWGVRSATSRDRKT